MEINKLLDIYWIFRKLNDSIPDFSGAYFYSATFFEPGVRGIKYPDDPGNLCREKLCRNEKKECCTPLLQKVQYRIVPEDFRYKM